MGRRTVIAIATTASVVGPFTYSGKFPSSKVTYVKVGEHIQTKAISAG